MRRPIVFVSSAVAFVLVLVLVLGWACTRGKIKMSAYTKPTTQSKEVPQYIVYHWMFRHVVWLDAKAAELDARGQNGAVYRNHYKNHACLTDEHAALLSRIAAETVDKVKQIDAEAKPIIEALRTQAMRAADGKPRSRRTNCSAWKSSARTPSGRLSDEQAGTWAKTVTAGGFSSTASFTVGGG